ncbi:sensor histidine kinase [Qipengyuania xiapuensis]|uniref:histidine kinase n=1 Tax=Qipengyuania xiapuensis TaxID=2867236 RepID=A0ABX8ZSN2_9SPHN|nr:sensor histidine kinase [Qipengyuania xiapuensis]QZD92033.1 sensor histidine kinase [Qipengyuania xiapuensis]
MDSFTDVWQYMPHGMCLLWQPWLLLLWAGSDMLIFLSYSAIPIALLTVLRQRKDIPHAGLVVLFASFILLCGLTHLLSIVTLWYPIYPYVGLVKLATGVVSAITAITLFRLIPTLIAFPSPAELRETNDKLRDEIAAHEKTLATLEATVANRTAELREANAKLSVQAREAVHRSANLLSVVSSLTKQTARGHSNTDEFIDTLTGRIRSLALATSTVMRGTDQYSGDLVAVVREQLEPLLMAHPDAVEIKSGSLEIAPDAAQQISLAVHELATNAQKYGLSQSGEGAISLSWEVSGRDADQRFVLQWEETLSEAEREGWESDAGGFGTKLLTRIVPQMLGGTATRTMYDGKLTYRLEAPASSVLADPEDREAGKMATRLVDENFGLS